VESLSINVNVTHIIYIHIHIYTCLYMYIYIYIYVYIRMYVDMHIYIHININIYLFVTIVERGKFVARYECNDCNMSVHLVLTTDSPGISVSTYIYFELSANKNAYIIYTCIYIYICIWCINKYVYIQVYLHTCKYIYIFRSVRYDVCNYVKG
jgi:hypothetical protein